MVAEHWCYKSTTMALLMVSASVAMAVHLWKAPMEALDSEFQQMARKDDSPRKFGKDGVALDYITEEIYVKVPRGGLDDVKYCKAETYLQAENGELNYNTGFKVVSNLSLVNGATTGGNYMVQNDLMTLEKYDIKVNEHLVKFSFKTFDNEVSLAFVNKDIKEVFWQVSFVKELYEMITALMDVNPAMEMDMHFEIFNNYDYMVDFVNKLHYVKVKFVSAWQPTCLALWWLLAPHSGSRYLQWIGCLSDVVGGQIFLQLW